MPRWIATMLMVLEAGCAGVQRDAVAADPPGWKEPLSAVSRAARCTAHMALLCAKYRVSLDGSTCRAHVESFDRCTNRASDDSFIVPSCDAVLDRFFAKKETEGSIADRVADATVWVEEFIDGRGEYEKNVILPDDEAGVGLACVELFKLSRHPLHLQTNSGMARYGSEHSQP